MTPCLYGSLRGKLIMNDSWTNYSNSVSSGIQHNKFGVATISI